MKIPHFRPFLVIKLIQLFVPFLFFHTEVYGKTDGSGGTSGDSFYLFWCIYPEAGVDPRKEIE